MLTWLLDCLILFIMIQGYWSIIYLQGFDWYLLNSFTWYSNFWISIWKNTWIKSLQMAPGSALTWSRNLHYNSSPVSNSMFYVNSRCSMVPFASNSSPRLETSKSPHRQRRKSQTRGLWSRKSFWCSITCLYTWGISTNNSSNNARSSHYGIVLRKFSLDRDNTRLPSICGP